MKRISLLLVLLLGVLAAAAFWNGWLMQTPPNVVLITVDTLRPDRLSSYGYEKHRTPNFDRLAQEGVLFENAFCDVTWTTPSMASVMTGRYATAHGLRSSFNRLSEDAVTLAELLRDAGVQTAAIVASYPLAPLFGLDQGFSVYDAEFTQRMIEPGSLQVGKRPTELGEVRQWIVYHAAHSAYRSDTEVSDRAIQWLRQEGKEPFFLWLHYFGPHEKPQPTDDVAEQVRLQREQYDPDVVTADREVGRVMSALEELDIDERTAVIVHADHGQSLTEHGYFGHGRNIYDPTQRVPLLMRLPGTLPSGVRVSRLVRNLDLFSTILDLMGLEGPEVGDGESLVPLAAGRQNDGPQETYVETYLSANRLFAMFIGPEKQPVGFRRLGVRTSEWKFVANDPFPLVDDDDPTPITPEIRSQYYSEELYDLRADPGETVNLASARRDLVASFWKKLRAYQSLGGPGSETVKLDEKSRDRLRALGYLAE